MNPSKQVEHIPIKQLSLDIKNPRLPQFIEQREQQILEYLARETSIEELMRAIGENGFFPGEPLIVFPHSKKDKHYIVIEGNRRLTALRLLQNYTLLPSTIPKYRTIEKVSQEAIHKPTEVPVVIYDTREEVFSYLGHRHITGVKPWSSLCKARYLRQLFDSYSNTELSNSEKYKTVARIVGSRSDHVKRNLFTFAIYQIIKEFNYFDIPDLDETNLPFSVFYTAFNHGGIREFIDYPDDPINSTEKTNVENLKWLTKWLCEKTKGGSTTLVNPTNLKKLSKVVSSSHALKELKNGSPLEIAYRRTDGLNSEFVQTLHDISFRLQSANGILAEISLAETGHGKAEVNAAIDSIVKQTKGLKQGWGNLIKGEDED